MFVTAGTRDYSDLLDELVEALDGLGVEARANDDALSVDGSRCAPLLVARSHPTPADLRSLIADSRTGGPVVVIADRISGAGRDILRSAGWGWLDRRGHLRLWTPGLRIESPLQSAASVGRPPSGNLWTTVGLEIALFSLVHPSVPVAARRVAPTIGRSVGATHELITRFAAAGLIGQRTHLPLLPDLFWETAASWPDSGWTALPVTIDAAADRVGPDELIRVDERAATLGGARVASAGELPARCYVRSAAALRRLKGLADQEESTRCWVRRPPVDWIPLNEGHPPDATHPWSIAHPMVCALRLAADPARGREIVDDWKIVPGGKADA